MRDDDLLRSESILPSQAPGGAAPQQPPRPAGQPDRIGPFEVRGVLGEGGMGVVYRAWDPTARREVALKLVRGVQDERRLQRFEREGEITARLIHPGILRVHAAGEADGQPYLAYELIEGARSLGDLFPELTWGERVERVLEAARALGVAHAQGVTHRDVKPDNLLIAADGTLKVADFGLGFATDVERLTQTGVMLGTPLYMAPEQAQGTRAVGPASDVWSLGVLLYEALTGALPFEAQTLAELVIAISSRAPAPPSERDPEIPAALSAVCMRALSKDPGERYATGAALAEAIEAALTATPERPRAVAVGLTLAGLAVVAVAVALASSERPGTPETAPGQERVDVRSDAGGGVASPEVPPPAWFKPGLRSPSTPLPPGIRFGDAPGEYVNIRDGSVLVWVPPGTFRMGRNVVVGANAPEHQVTLTEGYFIGKYEVSWAQFDRFTDAAGLVRLQRRFPVTDEHPAHGISWGFAQQYCAWAGLRLPTEAEWERAARDPRGFYPWGDARPTPERVRQNPHAKMPGNDVPEPEHRTRPVREGVSGASPYGCVNIAGNVWEWVQDWFVGYSGAARTDPVGHDPAKASAEVLSRFRRHGRTKTFLRVIRGGSYRTSEPLFHTYHRDGFRPTVRRKDVGFRVAIAPSDRTAPALQLRWTVRFFASTRDPKRETAAWRAAGEASDAKVERDDLRLYFRDQGPSDLPDNGPAVREAKLPRDGFGTIATTTARLSKGSYRLSCISDGAARVWVDDELVIDAWTEHSPKRDDRRLTVEADREWRLRVEHFEGRGGATLHVWLERWRP